MRTLPGAPGGHRRPLTPPPLRPHVPPVDTGWTQGVEKKPFQTQPRRGEVGTVESVGMGMARSRGNRIWKAASFAAAFFFAAGVACASTKELQSAVYEAVPFGSERADLVARGKMARAIIAYWQDFNAKVLRLSPAENEWLKTEIGKTGERVNRAINRKEFALWSLDLRIGVCIDRAKDIQAVQSELKNKEREMFY